MKQGPDQSHLADAVARGYEDDDLNNNGLLVFLFFFVLTAVVLHTALWVLTKYYLSSPRAEDRPPSAIELTEQFPEPELQPSVDHNTTPWEDMAALRQDEGRIFERLGWKNDADRVYPEIPQRIVDELKHRAATRPSSATTKSAAPTRGAKEGRP